MNEPNTFSRRQMLGGLGALATAAMLPTSLWAQAARQAADHRYRISACDWIMLKRQKLGAIKLASEVGCDGVEVDMGGLGDRPTFDSQLAKEEVRGQFKEEAAKYGIAFSSIAMSGFYAQSFAQRDGIDRVVQDAVDTTTAMGVKTIFLPLGVRSDLVKHPELRPAVVERLKRAGEMAEKAGVVIGIESAYDAAAEAELLDEIGSKGIRSYFNFANALQNDRDLHAELKTLGLERICQIHCTNQDVFWLQDDPKIDMPKVKQTLDEMGYRGWLVIERSRRADKGRDVKLNFSTNAAYLKKIFQA